MSIARRWVFPVVWMVIFGAIAAALVKTAFFPDSIQASDRAEPSAELIEPQYEVTTGTVRSDLALSVKVAQDAPVNVPATLTGQVQEVAAVNGQAVAAGQELFKLRAMLVDDEGSPAGTRWMIVTAATSGTLTGFAAVNGQSVSAGDVLGKIVPPTYHVKGDIPPEQLYRIPQWPAEAEVTIKGGPEPFSCTGLTLVLPDPGSEAQGSTSVRCAVPPEVRVFPGLDAQLTIAGGIAENVIVVPLTAIEGDSSAGIVYLVGAAGDPEPREVELGLSDGRMIEVTSGLAVGDLIFEFPPGDFFFDGGESFMDDGCVEVAPGEFTCDGFEEE